MAQTGEEYAEHLLYVASGRPKSRSLQPLRRILPFLYPYRWRIGFATFALLISSVATLAVPALLRLVIDHLGAAELNQLSRYLLVFLAAAAVLAVATAARFYFVTWIGERVVADLRKAVFDHIVGLAPAFFELTRTGEVVSRLTADTTVIQTVVGSSIPIAMRNVIIFVGGLAMMAVTSAKLTGLVMAAVLFVMMPLLLFGRWVRALSRRSQDRVADTSARASRSRSSAASSPCAVASARCASFCCCWR